MRSVHFLAFATLLVGLAGCEDDPLKSDGPEDPTPPTQGIQAYLQVDNEYAKPGGTVHIAVKVQIGTESDAKVGSYTGRLRFDVAALRYKDEVKINDGLRVSNPNGAGDGEIRFAGAAARGFAELTLYEGVFEVKQAGYVDGLALEMEELSAALSLSDLQPQLHIAPRVFFRRSAN